MAILLLAGAGAALYMRGRARAGEAPLSAAEEAEAARLMANADTKAGGD